MKEILKLNLDTKTIHNKKVDLDFELIQTDLTEKEKEILKLNILTISDIIIKSLRRIK